VPVVTVVLVVIAICIYLRLRKPKQSFEGMSNFDLVVHLLDHHTVLHIKLSNIELIVEIV